MEIDALLLLTRLLKSLNFTETELLIMQSYIINKNIDINLSLRENACLLMEENITSIEMCKDVRGIIIDNSDYATTPIYKLLLENQRTRCFIINALAKKLLNDESVLDIVETVLNKIDEGDFIHQNDLIRFLMDFLSTRRLTRKNAMQESRIINEYVKKTEVLVLNENDRFTEDYCIRFYRRMLLYKLFSCGFVSFDYNQKLDSESLDSGVASIVRPLVLARSYGHLRLMINGATLNSDSIEELKLVIKDAFKVLYGGEVSKEEAENDKIFIDKLNIFFRSTKSDILDYQDISKREMEIKF